MTSSHRIAVLFLCVLSTLMVGCSSPLKFSDKDYRALGDSIYTHHEH
ncbi:hypothetical protein PSFL111601_06930 [Pseudomonas floridensis]